MVALIASLTLWGILILSECRNCKYLFFVPIVTPLVSLYLWHLFPEPMTLGYLVNLGGGGSLACAMVVVCWMVFKIAMDALDKFDEKFRSHRQGKGFWAEAKAIWQMVRSRDMQTKATGGQLSI